MEPDTAIGGRRSGFDQGSPRGVALMLWLGADPHAEVPSSAYEEDRQTGIGDTAFESALWGEKPEIIALVMKRPIPKSKLDSLLRLAAHRSRPALVARLLEEGADPNQLDEENEPVLQSFVSALVWRYSPRSTEEQERALRSLELVLNCGASLTTGSAISSTTIPSRWRSTSGRS